MEKEFQKEIERKAEKLLSEIAAFEKKAKEEGLEFTSLSKREIIDKLLGKTSRSPFIYFQLWNPSGHPGQTRLYRVGIHNPDDFTQAWLCVSVFFGIANFLPDIGVGLCGRFHQWPVLSSKYFSLSAGSSTTKDFNYTIPNNAPLTTYPGNSVLWQCCWYDVGKYFDRGGFYMTVT